MLSWIGHLTDTGAGTPRNLHQKILFYTGTALLESIALTSQLALITCAIKYTYYHLSVPSDFWREGFSSFIDHYFVI